MFVAKIVQYKSEGRQQRRASGFGLRASGFGLRDKFCPDVLRFLPRFSKEATEEAATCHHGASGGRSMLINCRWL